MKLLLAIMAICLLQLTQSGYCYAQNTAKSQLSKDSTPIEDLDYHLNKNQFIYYYGTDDTARAIIHMFYRKRGSAGVEFAVIPLASFFVAGGTLIVGILESLVEASGATILLASGVSIYVVGIIGIPLYFAIRRSIYTRQKLIYVLVGRERGLGIPEEIMENLRESDFR